MIIPLPIGLLGSNCYLVIAPRADDSGATPAAIVDPGMTDAAPLFAEVQQRGLAVRFILNTHGHFDHVVGNAHVAFAGARLGIHPADRPLLAAGGGAGLFGQLHTPSPEPDLDLADGAVLTLGNDLQIEVVHTPGHTPGSICLYIARDAALLTGDTLFAQGVGRTDLPGGDPQALVRSLRRILAFPEPTRIYPGHGGTTTLAHARHTNPRLRQLSSGSGT